MFILKKQDKLSKEMQIAGIKEVLKNLKSIENYGHYEIEPMLKTLKNILSSYNCICNKCLKKRINFLLDEYNTDIIRYNAMSLIAELESLLKSIDEQEIPKL